MGAHVLQKPMSVALGSGMARLLPTTHPSAPHSNAMANASTPRLSLLCHHGRVSTSDEGMGSTSDDGTVSSSWVLSRSVAWSMAFSLAGSRRSGLSPCVAGDRALHCRGRSQRRACDEAPTRSVCRWRGRGLTLAAARGWHIVCFDRPRTRARHAGANLKNDNDRADGGYHHRDHPTGADRLDRRHLDVRRPCPRRTADQRHRQDRLGHAIVGGPSAAFRPITDGFQLYLKMANDKGLLPGYNLSPPTS